MQAQVSCAHGKNRTHCQHHNPERNSHQNYIFPESPFCSAYFQYFRN